MKKDKQIKIDKRLKKFTIYGSLQTLLDDIRGAGYKSEDYKLFDIELDYSSCYYPDETPSICAVKR